MKRRRLGLMMTVWCLWMAHSAAGAATENVKRGGRPLRYLALGDSYTIGEGVEDSGRWPVQLAALLREKGIPLEEPAIIARTGWTVSELDAAIDEALAGDSVSGPYDLVSLLIGVNDQYRGHDAEGYRRELAAMLRRAIGFAGGEPGRVLVLSIPDWGVTPFAEGRDRRRIAAEIDRYNAINREESHRAGARYVDVTPASRKAGAEPKELVGDGLHPSAVQYAEWARLAVPEAQAILKR